jgi:hypothetical protein
MQARRGDGRVKTHQGRILFQFGPKSGGFPSKTVSTKVPSDHKLESDGELAGWICRIQAACAREANNVLELARLIWQARESLRPHHGSWGKLWKSGKMAIGKRLAEKYVVVGEGFDGLSANDRSHLPAAFSTLYCLAHLGRERIEDLIAQGRIHAGLKLKEAEALVAEFLPGTVGANSRQEPRTRLERFARYIRKHFETWSQQQRNMVAQELTVLIEEIRAANGETATARKTGEVRETGASERSVKRKNQNDSIRQML